jgi:hypothetical protein
MLAVKIFAGETLVLLAAGGGLSANVTEITERTDIIPAASLWNRLRLEFMEFDT